MSTRPLIGLCDRCGTPVRNYGTVSVSPDTGRTLIFCGHHTNVHRVALTLAGWLILEPTLVEPDELPKRFPWLDREDDCDTDEDEAHT